MSLERTVFMVIKNREDHKKIRPSIPLQAFDERNRFMVKAIDRYFRENDEVLTIDFDSFWVWFATLTYPKLGDEDKQIYRNIAQALKHDVDPSVKEGLKGRLVAMDAADKLLKTVDGFLNGDEIDLRAQVGNIVEAFDDAIDRKVKQPWVQDDINDLLQDDRGDWGFKWRLDALNKCMRPARPGDFILGAARPDVGKTTFYTDQLTFMAAQVDKLFPGEDRTILWINNEGLGKRIKTRLYQSALDETIAGLLERQTNGTIVQDYIEATGGRNDIIRIMDCHDFWNHEVEDIIREHNPAIVLFDMIDNIKFGGMASNNGQRTDQLLEAMYQWGRICAVKHDCIVMATSQISADGENLQYPLLGMLKDSKTGKQGAADAIITIGYNSDYPNSRYLGATKNKLAREGAAKSPKEEVFFDGARGRYRPITEIKEDDNP